MFVPRLGLSTPPFGMPMPVPEPGLSVLLFLFAVLVSMTKPELSALLSPSTMPMTRLSALASAISVLMPSLSSPTFSI